MKSFLVQLWIFLFPDSPKEVLIDKHPGRKPPSVMPRPPIQPPKYEPDYPDVDEMYRRFIAAKRKPNLAKDKARKKKDLFD